MAKTLVRRLTKSAKEALKEHSLHHTRKHITKMKDLMRVGVSFTRAHKMATEEKGK